MPVGKKKEKQARGHLRMACEGGNHAGERDSSPLYSLNYHSSEGLFVRPRPGFESILSLVQLGLEPGALGTSRVYTTLTMVRPPP